MPAEIFHRRSTAIPRSAAILIALGGMCLAVKALAILLTGVQPPLLFEIAGLPLGLGLLMLGHWSTTQYGRSRLIVVAAILSSLAALASASKALLKLAEPLESLQAVFGGFGPMVAALLIGLRLRAVGGVASKVARRALLISIMFIPLMILGAMAAELAGERFLELGLLAFAALWLLLAHAVGGMSSVSVTVEGRDTPPDLLAG
ncbi:MAG: hypothetical protein H0V79_07745 [Actinobacteria bacterium]|nr:hypothetical protein [Actinomycetota bacterium]